MALGILTSGGDAPGMNAAIAYLTRYADARDWRVLGVREGFRGLLERRAVQLGPVETWSRARHGGTILGSSRLQDFSSHAAELRQALGDLEITQLAILGGNGSLLAGALLVSDQLAVVGLPATIDNDVADSDEAIGFNTALDTGVRHLDGIRDAAEAMPHVFALEVLGGGRGFLAAAVARAGGADAVLLPQDAERADAEAKLTERVRQAVATRRYAILVTPEYYPGIDQLVARVSAAVGEAPRFARIGHAQRGGVPGARDRLLALELARVAIDALKRGESGRAVWQRSRPRFLSYAEFPGGTKPPDNPELP